MSPTAVCCNKNRLLWCRIKRSAMGVLLGTRYKACVWRGQTSFPVNYLIFMVTKKVHGADIWLALQWKMVQEKKLKAQSNWSLNWRTVMPDLFWEFEGQRWCEVYWWSLNKTSNISWCRVEVVCYYRNPIYLSPTGKHLPQNASPLTFCDRTSLTNSMLTAPFPNNDINVSRKQHNFHSPPYYTRTESISPEPIQFPQDAEYKNTEHKKMLWALILNFVVTYRNCWLIVLQIHQWDFFNFIETETKLKVVYNVSCDGIHSAHNAHNVCV